MDDTQTTFFYWIKKVIWVSSMNDFTYSFLSPTQGERFTKWVTSFMDDTQTILVVWVSSMNDVTGQPQ